MSKEPDTYLKAQLEIFQQLTNNLSVALTEEQVALAIRELVQHSTQVRLESVVS